LQKLALLCITSVLCTQSWAKSRGATSVHLAYPSRPSTVFYNELTVDVSAPGAYFMVCGFRQGYFCIPSSRISKETARAWNSPAPPDSVTGGLERLMACGHP